MSRAFLWISVLLTLALAGLLGVGTVLAWGQKDVPALIIFGTLSAINAALATHDLLFLLREDSRP